MIPLGSLPWSSCCADVVDNYGVNGYIKDIDSYMKAKSPCVAEILRRCGL